MKKFGKALLNVLGYITVVVVGFAIYNGINNVSRGDLATAKAELINAELQQLRAQLPMMVDTETRADAIMYANDTISYFYTLVNINEQVYLDADRAAFMVELADVVKPNACTMFAPPNKIGALVDTAEYTYKDAKGLILGRLTVKKSVC